MFVSQGLLDCYRSTCWSFARFARFSSPVCDDWNTSKWWSRAATHLSRVTERSFPEKRLSTRQPKKINKIPQRVLETKSPKQEINKRKKFGVRGQSCKGQFPFPKPLAVLLSVLCADCCSALPCSYPRSKPPLGNLVWSKFGEGNLDAINHPPSGKFDDGRAYMGGTSHGDLQLFNKTWADAYAVLLLRRLHGLLCLTLALRFQRWMMLWCGGVSLKGAELAGLKLVFQLALTMFTF